MSRFKVAFSLILAIATVSEFVVPKVASAFVERLPVNSHGIPKQATNDTVIGQVPPNIITPQPPQPLPQNPQTLPPPDELLKPPAQTAPPDLPSSNGTITVAKFDVLGSTVFSQEELAEVTNAYIKRPITFAQLLEVRTKITELYVRNGYITSGAFIPPQNLQAGTIKVQVIEGSLEEVRITGTNRLSPDYIRSRINIATGAPLNRDRLISALQLLQINPLIANLSAELAAGDRPGKNILEIKVKEAESFNAQLSLDNNRAPSVGSLRRRIQVSEANLTGLGDSILVGYSNTDASNAYDLSYSLPVNPYNGTISILFSNSNSNVIEKPFNILDIYSNSTSYDLTFRQPVYQTPNQELAIGVTGSYRESLSSLLKIPFPLSAGADNNGSTRVSILSFFQEFTERESRSVLALRSQLNIGFGGVLGSTVNSAFPDSRFVSWRGQAQYVNLLAPSTLLLFRGDLQLSDRPLVPLQQIGFGGQDTLRGYRQDLLLGDNGVALTAELRIPVMRIPEIDGLLQIAPFIDTAMVWTSSGGENPAQNLLVGTGFGLRWQMGNRMTALFNYGIPLMSVPNTRNTWQENGIYFSLIYNLF
ncbi:ShlB/FhaC/HecB family hemolysin secretion/activation protein [Tumidithrix elongata RA019]|uniref:ShlB/FhaC/HecB family hemolysin secretion/activation protein n=1 Tax=Tumidithrix elongata BACA0141 TaxID=2716417 RepID=A0AAW9Q417_9CYAN|nr:ShlB/FhaC/HecB family hemolysin secretion/activation protein [Tumidithrix elongata RA019]